MTSVEWLKTYLRDLSVAVPLTCGTTQAPAFVAVDTCHNVVAFTPKGTEKSAVHIYSLPCHKIEAAPQGGGHVSGLDPECLLFSLPKTQASRGVFVDAGMGFVQVGSDRWFFVAYSPVARGVVVYDLHGRTHKVFSTGKREVECLTTRGDQVAIGYSEDVFARPKSTTAAHIKVGRVTADGNLGTLRVVHVLQPSVPYYSGEDLNDMVFSEDGSRLAVVTRRGKPYNHSTCPMLAVEADPDKKWGIAWKTHQPPFDTASGVVACDSDGGFVSGCSTHVRSSHAYHDKHDEIRAIRAPGAEDRAPDDALHICLPSSGAELRRFFKTCVAPGYGVFKICSGDNVTLYTTPDIVAPPPPASLPLRVKKDAAKGKKTKTPDAEHQDPGPAKRTRASCRM
jgi:hypothetical protein